VQKRTDRADCGFLLSADNENGMQFDWRAITGPALTTATALTAFLIDRLVVSVPNPAPLFVCIVAYAASVSGITSGMISAVIAVASSALFFLNHRATPGYDVSDLSRMLLLAATAGGNLISEVAGMVGSLMGVSFEAMVMDNEMLGIIQRTLKGIEVSDDTLSFEVIKDVIEGPGHYLGHAQTLALMDREYLYPTIADRSSLSAWEEEGSIGMLDKARKEAKRRLTTHYPQSIDPKIDAEIRARFPIRLAESDMRPGNGRW